MLLVIFLSIIILILTIKLKLCININENGTESFIKIYVYNKIYIWKINLNKLNKKYTSRIGSSFKNQLSMQSIKKTVLLLRKECLLDIEKLDIKASICMSDAILTSYFTCLISSLIPITIKVLNFKINTHKFRYEITPLYVSKNVLDVDIKCIFSVNLIHNILIIWKLRREWRSDEHGRKSSNRKAYGNCHE